MPTEAALARSRATGAIPLAGWPFKRFVLYGLGLGSRFLPEMYHYPVLLHRLTRYFLRAGQAWGIRCAYGHSPFHHREF